MIKAIFVLSGVLVIVTYIQFFVPSLYFTYIFPVFTPGEQEIVVWLYAENGMNGLTNQTGYNAFLMNLGLIIVFSRLILLNGINSCSKRLSLSILALIYIAAILMTMKRSFVVIMAIEIMVSIFVKQKILQKKKKNVGIRKLIILSALVILVVFLIVSPLNNFFRNFSDDINVNNINELTSGRTRIYSAGFKMFTLNPLFGNGMDSTPDFLETEFNMRRYQQMHNIYIQMLAELGVIGFIILSALIAYYYVITIQAIKFFKKYADRNAMFNLIISLLMQTAWMIYGIFGNTLTVHNQLLTYIIFCSIPSHYFKVAQGSKQKVQDMLIPLVVRSE